MADPTGFDTELDRARSLLDADDLTAVHVGVIHDDQTVDTVASRRTDGDSEAELLAISLLATHIRAVAADAAAVAAQLESLPVDSPADPDDSAADETSTESSESDSTDG